MGNNYKINREIAVLLIAINKLYKEIASLRLELAEMENDNQPEILNSFTPQSA